MKRFIRITSLFSALIIISGCQEQLFTEYDNESFISKNMAAPDVWELMPDYDFASEGTAVTDYMDYSLVSTGTGPNSANVYRLEIYNLMDNGTFEDGNTNPWKTYQSGVPVPTLDFITTGHADDAYMIDGDTAYFDINGGDKAYILLPDDLEPTRSAAYISNKNYVFGFSYRTISVLDMYFEPDWTVGSPEFSVYKYQAKGGVDGSQTNISLNNINVYPPKDAAVAAAIGPNVFTASYDTASDALAFGSDTSLEAYFDSVTIVRDSEENFNYRLKVELDLDQREDLKMISGYYRFSVYVREEAVLPAYGTHAQSVELTIRGLDSGNQMEYYGQRTYYKTQELQNLYDPSNSWTGDWSAGWVELVLESSRTIQLPNYSSTPVMELTISPSNPGSSSGGWNRLAPGSIEISNPTLEFIY